MRRKMDYFLKQMANTYLIQHKTQSCIKKGGGFTKTFAYKLQTRHQNTLWISNRKSTLSLILKAIEVRFLFQPANNHHRTCVGLNVRWVPDLCSLVGYAENFELFSHIFNHHHTKKTIKFYLLGYGFIVVSFLNGIEQFLL